VKAKPKGAKYGDLVAGSDASMLLRGDRA